MAVVRRLAFNILIYCKRIRHLQMQNSHYYFSIIATKAAGLYCMCFSDSSCCYAEKTSILTCSFGDSLAADNFERLFCCLVNHSVLRHPATATPHTAGARGNLRPRDLRVVRKTAGSRCWLVENWKKSS